MRTDDLIQALQADAAARRWPQMRVWWAAAFLALCAAALDFLVLLSPRPDLAAMIGTPRVLFKLAFAAAVAGSAFAAARALSRPEAPARPLLWLIVPLSLLLAAVAIELASVPAADWSARMVGAYPLDCVVLIPAVGLLPLAVTLLALRHGAPTRPLLAGAAAGLLSGGLAALLYAMHCRDDSPLFVAIWYSAALIVMALLGALGGRFFARW